MSSAARKALILLFILVVVFTLLYRSREAIGLKDFSWSQLTDSVRHANLALLLLSLAGIQACYALRAWRWTRFSRYLARATLSHIFSGTVIGFTAIFLLGRAGEPLRPLLIARKDEVPVSSTFGIYVLERMFDMASTVVMAAIALLAMPRLAVAGRGDALLNAARTTGTVLLVGLVAGIAFLIYFRLRGAELLEKHATAWRATTVAGWRRRAAGLVTGFSEGLQAIRTWGDLLSAVAVSAVHWGLVAYVYYWIARSFGGRLAELGVSDALLVLAFTMAGSTVQLPGVGGGSQVASFLAYTVIFGVDKEPAAAVSIVIWLITFAGATVFGIPLLIKEGWSMGELRRLARAEAEAEKRGDHVPVPPEASKRVRQAVHLEGGDAPR